MHRYLSQCDPNDLFMYVDAYDVIFLAGKMRCIKSTRSITTINWFLVRNKT